MRARRPRSAQIGATITTKMAARARSTSSVKKAHLMARGWRRLASGVSPVKVAGRDAWATVPILLDGAARVSDCAIKKLDRHYEKRDFDDAEEQPIGYDFGQARAGPCTGDSGEAEDRNRAGLELREQ